MLNLNPVIDELIKLPESPITPKDVERQKNLYSKLRKVHDALSDLDDRHSSLKSLKCKFDNR